jgi:uncharacterized membrane protein
LAWPVALFPAALLSDIAYLNTAEMQWSNFAAWLITGALLFGGMALVFCVVSAVRERSAGARSARFLNLLLLALAWIAGLVNAFHHSRDAWSSVGTAGLLLSIASSTLALAAGWIAYAGIREKNL